jgi:hypothetical protein
MVEGDPKDRGREGEDETAYAAEGELDGCSALPGKRSVIVVPLPYTL